MSGEEDLYYNMDRSRLGLAVILNNLDKEQEPTKKDVEIMGSVLRDIGQIYNRYWMLRNDISKNNSVSRIRGGDLPEPDQPGDELRQEEADRGQAPPRLQLLPLPDHQPRHGGQLPLGQVCILTSHHL